MFPWTYQLQLLWLTGGQSEDRPLFISSLMCAVRESLCVLRYCATILNHSQFLPVHYVPLIFRDPMLCNEATVSLGFNFTSFGKMEERRKYPRVQVCSSLFTTAFHPSRCEEAFINQFWFHLLIFPYGYFIYRYTHFTKFDYHVYLFVCCSCHL